MTDQPSDPGRRETPPTPEETAASTSPEPESARSFEERMNRFGEEAREAGERLGRKAEAAGQRWSRDPAVMRAGDTATRIWGLLVLAVGLWFLADVTLGYDMPNVAWRDLWPVLLIGIGVVVVVRGMTRSRA